MHFNIYNVYVSIEVKKKKTKETVFASESQQHELYPFKSGPSASRLQINSERGGKLGLLLSLYDLLSHFYAKLK